VLRDPETRRVYDAERDERLSPVEPGIEQETQPPTSFTENLRAMSVDGTPDGDSMVSGLSARIAVGSAGDGQRASSASDVLLDFGRYAGSSLRDLARRDPDYLRWLARHSSGIRFRGDIARILTEPLDDPYAPSR
jgi:uncharacterized protein (DUF3820 family)